MLSELCEGVYDVDISHHSDVFLEQNLVPWCLPSFSHIKLVSFPSQLTSTSVILNLVASPWGHWNFGQEKQLPSPNLHLKSIHLIIVAHSGKPMQNGWFSSKLSIGAFSGSFKR